MKRADRLSAPRTLVALVGCIGAFICAAAGAQPHGGSAVSFDSPNATGAPVALRGVLYQPAGAAKGAFVLVHGSGGWSDPREGHHAADRIAVMGFSKGASVALYAASRTLTPEK